MRRLAAALIAAVATFPASAQVDCGAPLSGSDAKYAVDYARNLTLPLIQHNAGGLGPVVWTYIAGQAQGESNLTGKAGGFALKPGLNLWNTQTMPGVGGNCAAGERRSDTDVACKDENPNFVERKKAQLGQCWLSDKDEAMRTVRVCFRQFPDLGAAADNYVAFKPAYTNVLGELAKGTPTPQQFMDALDKSRWADKPDRVQYIKDTLASIDRALRGLATVRQQDSDALAEASKGIDAWCALPGVGNADEREALRAKQAKLLATLTTIGSVCTSPAGATPPTANRAIDTCRTQPDPPPPEPPSGPPGTGSASGQGPSDRDRTGGSDHRPSGYANGTGEPHYRLPGGLSLSTQRAGEFWLLDAPDGTRIQVRQVPWQQSRSVAAIGAIAAQVGPHRVGVYADGQVRVDGKALQWTGRFHQQALGNDAVVGVWGPREQPSQVAVMWRNGRTLRVHLRSSWLDLETAWTRNTSVATDRGLIGQASSTAGVLVGRDGRRGSLGNPNQADAFVLSWRIQAKESLFDYRPGESPATFDLRAFPETPAKPSQEELRAARAACAAAGVPSDRLDACTFDLAVTGSREFLVSHLPASVVAPAAAETKPPLRESYPALFTPDIANPVQTLPNGKRFDLSIGPGEQRTYRIDAKRGDPPVFLNVISNNLSCVAEAVDGSKPAYQLFDARGTAVSKAKPTCADLFSGDVEEGDYYLVIKGANGGRSEEVSLEAWAN